MEPDKTPRGSRRPPATAWKPGQSGNPAGRKTGSRNRATLLAQALIDGKGNELVQKAVELALDGDPAMLRVLIERLVPPRKDAPIRVKLPGVKSAADLPSMTGAILTGVADGRLTPSEAQAVAGLVEVHRKALELSEIERRLTALETKETER